MFRFHDNERQQTCEITFLCNVEAILYLLVSTKVVTAERKKKNNLQVV